MEISLSKFKQKHNIRDFVKDPIDIADVLILLMSFFILTGLTRSSTYGIGNITAMIANFGGFVVVFAGMVLLVSDIDKEKYLKPVAFAFLILILISSITANDVRHQANADVGAFSIYSAELFINGENPYEESMSPAFDMFENVNKGTPLMEGGYVESLSYPSLSFLYLVPQVAMGYYNPFITSFIFVIMTGVLLVGDLKPQYSLLGAFTFHFFVNIVNFSPIEFTWILMMLLGIRFWKPRRYLSLVLLGISFSFKQIPWFIAPFLMVWIVKENKNHLSGLKEIFKQFGLLGAVFLIPNIPFIVDNFMAWVKGVFTPMSSTGTLIQLGEGFVQLSLTAGFLPNSFFTAVMLLFMVCLASFYWLYFDELKWMAWITPSLILWFNYRSAGKYMAVMIPILMYTYAVKNDLTVGSNKKWLKVFSFGK